MGKEKELGIDHIYVVHAPVGYERHEQHLAKLLGEEYGFDYEFITRDAVERIPEYFIPDINKVISKGTTLCSLNHITFYERIVENNDKYALILEDDCFFIGNFADKLRRVIAEARTLDEGVMISLENSTLEFPSRKLIRKGKYLYENNHGRCAGAYILDQKAARNILNRLKTHKADTVIDHWHNTLIRDGVIKMYWAEPVLVEQGSLNGKLSSVNSNRTQGLKRKMKWLAQKYYKTYLVRYFK